MKYHYKKGVRNVARVKSEATSSPAPAEVGAAESPTAQMSSCFLKEHAEPWLASAILTQTLQTGQNVSHPGLLNLVFFYFILHRTGQTCTKTLDSVVSN